jgi:predicted nucleic acid-binding protein
MAVIDASVWVALFQEKDVFHLRATQLLDEVVAGGHPIKVPALVFAEVAGAMRRRTGKLKHASNAVAKMHDLDLDVREIDDNFGRLAADIAGRLGMRGADAFYVALAKETGSVLYTFDDEQRQRGGEEVETKAP